ncbi:hypothetical protein [Actinoplanes subglobosus]|uniref:Uncharacterized protein n=1 Tax=Actinoplanes subglobosus TaxID=1547892 RepID=A0ABV8ISG6_9ACTN
MVPGPQPAGDTSPWATAQYRIVGFAPFVVTGCTGLLGGVLSGVGSLLSSQPVFGTGRNFGATVIGRIG